jgi:hypothetical protein
MYIKIQNGEPHSFTLEQLRRENPQISFPRDISDEMLATWNVFPVRELPEPDIDTDTHYIAPGEFYQENNQWHLEHQILPRPRDQVEVIMRKKRNQLLAESDWSRMDDVPLAAEQKDQWAEYRQKLRDITTQQGFPYDVVWPQLP